MNYSPVMTADCRNENVDFAVKGNYSNNQVNVQFDAVADKQYVISLVDVSGKVIHTEMYVSGADESTEISIPAKNLASGVYLIRVETEQTSGIQNVVIE